MTLEWFLQFHWARFLSPNFKMNNSYEPKKKFMKIAIKEAKKSIKKGNYAYGAVVVKNDEIVGIGKQESHSSKDASAHAEIIAMRNASKNLKTMYLNECILYTTNEPCCMCTGMAIWSRLKGIVYGSSIKDLLNYWENNGNPQKLTDCKSILKNYGSDCFVIGGLMREECCKLFKLDKKIKRVN